jgi:hypothetical protein
MPSERDNDEERFNRIAALMEEYRVNHEDLISYIKLVQDRSANGRTRASGRLKAAREGAERSRRNRR